MDTASRAEHGARALAALLIAGGGWALPARAAPAPAGTAATVHVGGQTIRLWRQAVSGEIDLVRAGEAGVTGILGTALRQTIPTGGGDAHLIVDRYPSRTALQRIVRLRYGLTLDAFDAVLAGGRPGPVPAAVREGLRLERRATTGRRQPSLRRRRARAGSRRGHRGRPAGARGAGPAAPRREPAVASGDPAGTTTFLIYSDNPVDPEALGARTLVLQSTSAGLLRGHGPNPRLGGLAARRIDGSDIVFRLGRTVVLLSASEHLPDAQASALLTRARLVRPPG